MTTPRHMVVCKPQARPIRTPDELIERIQNDRWAENQVSHGGDPVTEPVYRRAFNDGSKHVEGLIHTFINEEILELSLRELAEAPAMDLSLKHALISGIGSVDAAPTSPAPAVAARDTATWICVDCGRECGLAACGGQP